MADALFINTILKNYFIIDRWGLIYWENGRDKVVNKYRFNKILLNVIINDIK